jgi:hypothetical protein
MSQPPHRKRTAGETPRRKRVIMAELKPLKDTDRSFDLRFWRRVGAEGRFAAAWQMIKELDLIRGGDGRQPRLQRSVARLEERGVRRDAGGSQ